MNENKKYISLNIRNFRVARWLGHHVLVFDVVGGVFEKLFRVYMFLLDVLAHEQVLL